MSRKAATDSVRLAAVSEAAAAGVKLVPACEWCSDDTGWHDKRRQAHENSRWTTQLSWASVDKRATGEKFSWTEQEGWVEKYGSIPRNE